jgi:mRNA interferase MazF
LVAPPDCPDAGDWIWIDLDPVKGHEQRSRRPALVLTARAYNQKSGLCTVCPVTNSVKGYPFEVAVPAGHEVFGAVLSDQPRAVAWAERKAKFIGRASPDIVDDVREKLAALLGID